MGIFARSSRNPVLTPTPAGWWKAYNPGAAVDRLGNIHLFPRVLRRELEWHSRIAHAISIDAETFRWLPDLSLARADTSEARGLEDPRITLIDGVYHMVFGVYDGTDVHLQTAWTTDLAFPWQREGPAVPDFRFARAGGHRVTWHEGLPVERREQQSDMCWSKSGAMFRLPDGRYCILFGEYKIWLGLSRDGRRFDVIPKPVIEARRGSSFFDNTLVEMGPPPILTEMGWLALYHGVDELHCYRLGLALLACADPSQVIFRSSEPIFGPREPYETASDFVDVRDGGIESYLQMSDEAILESHARTRVEHRVPQVVFCTGAILRGDMLWIYYGAADTTVCAACAPLSEVLALVG